MRHSNDSEKFFFQMMAIIAVTKKGQDITSTPPVIDSSAHRRVEKISAFIRHIHTTKTFVL
jgi:hypothetical protein